MESENIETVDGYWRIYLHKMEVKYNRLRHCFIQDTQQYYRQSIYGNYISEDNLIEQAQELKSLREEIQKISKEHYPDTNSKLYKEGFAEQPV